MITSGDWGGGFKTREESSKKDPKREIKLRSAYQYAANPANASNGSDGPESLGGGVSFPAAGEEESALFCEKALFARDTEVLEWE